MSLNEYREELQQLREYQLQDVTELLALSEVALNGTVTAAARKRRGRLGFEVARREEAIGELETLLEALDENFGQPSQAQDTVDAGETDDIPAGSASTTNPWGLKLPDNSAEIVERAFTEIRKMTDDPKNKMILDVAKGQIQDALKKTQGNGGGTSE